MTKVNALKTKRRAGEIAYGTFVQIPSPQVVEIAAAAGLDYVIIDMQHGVIGLETAANLIRAADAAGITSWVRVPSVDEALIGQVLDAGAMCVGVPEVANAEEARKAVRAAKFPPTGVRGACSVVRGLGYNAGPKFAEEADRETFVSLALEGPQALDELDDILALDGLDALSIGTFDLSFALGVGGQRGHPVVKDAIAKALTRIADSPVAGCMLVNGPEDAEAWLRLGIQLVTISLDARVLHDAYAARLQALRLCAEGVRRAASCASGT